MKPLLLATCCMLLLSAGLVALARWLHPATFSPHIVTTLLMLFAVSTVIYLWRYE